MLTGTPSGACRCGVRCTASFFETDLSRTGDIRSIEVAGFDFPSKDIAKCNVPILCGGQFHCDEPELVKDIDHVDFHTIDPVGQVDTWHELRSSIANNQLRWAITNEVDGLGKVKMRPEDQFHEGPQWNTAHSFLKYGCGFVSFAGIVIGSEPPNGSMRGNPSLVLCEAIAQVAKLIRKKIDKRLSLCVVQIRRIQNGNMQRIYLDNPRAGVRLTLV